MSKKKVKEWVLGEGYLNLMAQPNYHNFPNIDLTATKIYRKAPTKRKVVLIARECD